MKKRLPGIYKGEGYKNVRNNKIVFYSSVKNQSSESNDNIIYENEYFLNIPVIVETFEKKISCKIVGKVGDHILTSNNEIIKLKDIKSIKKHP